MNKILLLIKIKKNKLSKLFLNITHSNLKKKKIKKITVSNIFTLKTSIIKLPIYIYIKLFILQHIINAINYFLYEVFKT